MLNEKQKNEYFSESLNRLISCLQSCADDPFLQLRTGVKETPGNLSAQLATKILEKESNPDIEQFARSISLWLLPAINLPGNSAAREQSCRILNSSLCSSVYQNEWQKLLDQINVSTKSQADNMLYTYLITKSYERSMVWKNDVLINTDTAIDFDKIKITEQEEKVLRYVAGYIPFSLKKQFWSRRHQEIGMVVTELVCSWMLKEDKESDLQFSSLYEYTMPWTNRINRGGLMVVNEHFYVFIKRIEMIVRTILNKNLIITYDGEDLRDILFKKLENNELLDRSWCTITRNIECSELANKLKKLIFRKWISIRVKSFVNAWIQTVKRKASDRKLSQKAEPSLRKTLHCK